AERPPGAGEVGAALADRLVKEAGRERRRHQRADRERSRRLAEDRDVARIAAEGRDVVAHPAQRRDLIEQAVVARGAVSRLARQLGMREEAEDAEPVVERDDDDAFARQRLAVVARLGSGARLEAAAV